MTKTKGTINDFPDVNKNGITLKAKGGKWVNTMFEDICYIEANGNCTNIMTTNGKHTICVRLGIIMKKLLDPRFVKIHRAYVINIDKVGTWQGRRIFMNNEEIPIGDKYMAVFRSHFNF